MIATEQKMGIEDTPIVSESFPSITKLQANSSLIFSNTIPSTSSSTSFASVFFFAKSSGLMLTLGPEGTEEGKAKRSFCFCRRSFDSVSLRSESGVFG